MSTEDQEALIGRLVVERARASRQAALLLSEIVGTAILLGNISGNVGGQNPQYDVVLSRIEEIVRRGGLESMREQITERKSLEARIAEITKTLKDAGAE